MNHAWHLKATHTISLDYEQLQILEGGGGARPKVLFRGVWLSEPIDSDHLGHAAHAGPAAAAKQSLIDLVAQIRVAIDAHAGRRARKLWAEAIRTRLQGAFAEIEAFRRL